MKIFDQLVARSTGILHPDHADLHINDFSACCSLNGGDIGFWVCCKNATYFQRIPRPGSLEAITGLPDIMSHAIQINVARPGAHWYKFTVLGPKQSGIVAPTTAEAILSDLQGLMRDTMRGIVPASPLRVAV